MRELLGKARTMTYDLEASTRRKQAVDEATAALNTAIHTAHDSKLLGAAVRQAEEAGVDPNLIANGRRRGGRYAIRSNRQNLFRRLHLSYYAAVLQTRSSLHAPRRPAVR